MAPRRERPLRPCPLRQPAARQYPASAAVFDGMAAEENEHRRRLIDLHRACYGDLILPIRMGG
ncbi:ferritin family protein [Roseomonas sp. AR75]|uniref:ferritin family protein n=1 Tax=Roseomonas sp. AR75 TaxID=2562311 RepID=UPI0038D013D4